MIDDEGSWAFDPRDALVMVLRSRVVRGLVNFILSLFDQFNTPAWKRLRRIRAARASRGAARVPADVIGGPGNG